MNEWFNDDLRRGTGSISPLVHDSQPTDTLAHSSVWLSKPATQLRLRALLMFSYVLLSIKQRMLIPHANTVTWLQTHSLSWLTTCYLRTHLKHVTAEHGEALQTQWHNHECVMSVRTYGRLSVWIRHGSHWTDHHETLNWRLSQNCVNKFKIRLKSGKNIGNLTWRSNWGLLLQAELNRPESALVQHLIFLYCWHWRGAQQHPEKGLFRFHCHNDYGNAPQC
jgi:hypothetical protein